MNLHAIVSGYISAVNPTQFVSVQVSTGQVGPTQPDGSRLPVYAPAVTVPAQVQALSQSAIEHADAMNIQGVRRSIYLNGEVDGLVRVNRKGGDLISLSDGSVWLVQDIVEHWPDFTHCIVTLQTDSPPAASS